MAERSLVNPPSFKDLSKLWRSKPTQTANANTNVTSTATGETLKTNAPSATPPKGMELKPGSANPAAQAAAMSGTNAAPATAATPAAAPAQQKEQTFTKADPIPAPAEGVAVSNQPPPSFKVNVEQPEPAPAVKITREQRLADFRAKQAAAKAEPAPAAAKPEPAPAAKPEPAPAAKLEPAPAVKPPPAEGAVPVSTSPAPAAENKPEGITVTTSPAASGAERLAQLLKNHGFEDVRKGGVEEELAVYKKKTGLTEKEARDVAIAHIRNMEAQAKQENWDYKRSLSAREHVRSVRKLFKVDTGPDQFDIRVKGLATDEINRLLENVSPVEKDNKAAFKAIDQLRKESELTKDAVKILAAAKAAEFIAKSDGPGTNEDKANIIMDEFGLGSIKNYKAGKGYPELDKAMADYKQRLAQERDKHKIEALNKIKEITADDKKSIGDKKDEIKALRDRFGLAHKEILEKIAEGIYARSEREADKATTIKRLDQIKSENEKLLNVGLPFDRPTEMRKTGDTRGQDVTDFHQVVREINKEVDKRRDAIIANAKKEFGDKLVGAIDPERGIKGVLKDANKVADENELSSKDIKAVAKQQASALLAAINPANGLEGLELDAAMRVGAIIKEYGLRKDDDLKKQIAELKKALGSHGTALERLMKD